MSVLGQFALVTAAVHSDGYAPVASSGQSFPSTKTVESSAASARLNELSDLRSCADCDCWVSTSDINGSDRESRMPTTSTLDMSAHPRSWLSRARIALMGARPS